MPEISQDWWQGATIYQIYPRSFFDSTGNGVGDLPGISEKMDYIEALGVDAVWISPFVESPMLDFGYDVSNYLAVDPLFGTLDDFHHLVDQAHARGIKVLMDQVLSHTSDKHPWFLESREGRDNPKADWYVWADPDPAGAPPNNWLSVFGGSSWQWEPRRSQYYLHNFLRQQPDLNFHNPEVQQAVLDVCRFWLELGVDGFRLDVCAFYFHDAELRDNPPNEVAPSGSHFMFNPYSLQRHRYDIGRPENLAFIERLRGLIDSYDNRVLLGELNQEEGEKLHRSYTGPGRLQLAYGYWLLGAEDLSAGLVRQTAIDLGHEIDDGWPCWALDNHDFTRSQSRLGLTGHPDAAVVLTAALSSLRGAYCVYQGSELGLPEADVPYDRVVDPYGREFYPAYKGRDGARTPMPWNGDDPGGGFTTGKPWLPITDVHRDLAVDRQEVIPGSVLNRTRRFLNWRKDQRILREGAMTFLDCQEPLLAFVRTLDEGRMICVFNLSDDEARYTCDAHEIGTPLQGHGFASVWSDGALDLPAFGAYFGMLP